MWPKWVRGAVACWVGLDSSKRGEFSLFWFLIVLILGPFLVPLYFTLRSQNPDEKNENGFLLNFAENLKNFFAALVGFASLGVFAENLERIINGDLGRVKRAEVLAGSIFSFALLSVLLFIVKKINVFSTK
ncbi:MAG: hypothetical protein HQM10_20160 [Candidatus Riflebacteria bacterium]|nr:hypothetical protein [Candidatus Riflebacteria bacterium]